MTRDRQAANPSRTTRRGTLRALGTAVVGTTLATPALARDADGSFALAQDGDVATVDPLSGDRPVEQFYGYRLPDGYDAPGAVDATGGPYFQSVGTRSLQRESTTITFLYDGPDGVSLVVVHDAPTPDGDGGSATWTLAVQPESARWRVRDDWYVDADTGDHPTSNYDNWAREGTRHRVDWTWSATATDGGVLGYLPAQAAVHVDPAFNEAAALYGERYTGQVTAWEFLSGDRDDPDRTELALDESLAVLGPGRTDTPSTDRGNGTVGRERDGERGEADDEAPTEVDGDGQGEGASGERGPDGERPGRGDDPPGRGRGRDGEDGPPGRAEGLDDDEDDRGSGDDDGDDEREEAGDDGDGDDDNGDGDDDRDDEDDRDE